MELKIEELNLVSSMAAKWNYSQHVPLEDIKMDSTFMLLLASLICSVLWVVYITYYNSRLVAYFFTKMINRFYFQDENFKIGSLTINALSGKVMFRDIVYINYDYTLRIQDGYLIFRWWRAYVPKDVSEDLSHSDTRLSIMLNGFELHVYNRCDLYKELEKFFFLDSMIVLQGDDNNFDRDRAMNDANEKRRRAQGTVRSEAAMARTWRDLIPVIKIDICSGRIVFGNRLIPTTLSLSIEEAHLVYSTKPPASRLDHLMHFVKAKAENSKVMLAPSPNYIGMVDDPPRYMGEGFVIMSSNYIELYFYMDEAGLVPDQPVLLQLANGDVVESAPPIWGIDIKCGKGTDFSYGPWADRQREHLFKFFFPPNYQNMEVNPQPKPGDVRQTQSFDIRLSTLNEATIDILFSKNRETNAVHINIGAGSYLEVNLPWIVLQDGYTTKVTGQLLHLDATTSLQYRSLAESETLEFTVKCHYPLVWNAHQCWQLSLTGCKATANLVYAHKGFFQDLMNDWSSKVRPDILHFVPYTWKISLLLKEFELITISNEYNWIDCSSTNQENSHIAFCGDLFDLSFDLPFVDFLPLLVPLKIWIQGEGVDMSMFLPEVNSNRLIVLALDKNMKLLPGRPHSVSSKWRKKCLKSLGWIDCWSVPIVALSIKYSYHPVPPLGPDPQADITTPEKEEILLSPMRIPRTRKQPPLHWSRDGSRKFDPTTLPADKVSVELEIGPSVLLAYGSILRNFINLKENIFGEDQMFSDMQKNPTGDTAHWTPEANSKLSDKTFGGNIITSLSADDSSDSHKIPFDPRLYRPLDVTVSIIIHDIQAHLVKNCSESEPPCPVVLIERFGFEMIKGYHETKLQLLLSPSVLISPDKTTRSVQSHLSQGHLVLSSLQVRGHAMFSDENQSVDDETIEYSWMVEVQLGQLTGRLTAPQLYHVITSLETFVLLVGDGENSLLPPNSIKFCHHRLNKMVCTETNQPAKYYCPSSDEIKYRMTRVAIDSIDIYLVENGTALQTWLSPIRLSICNLHGMGFETGVTGLLSNLKLKQYISSNFHRNNIQSNSSSNHNGEHWLEVGVLTLGPLLLEAATSLPQTPKSLHQVQQKFLRLHDEKTKRLWFLWPNEATNKNPRCGCTGGCAFFGSNRNGSNFLKPSRSDLQDGINMAVFKILELDVGDFGYGQSILHENQLVFHTPPYNGLNICLQGMGKHLKTPSPVPPTITPCEQRKSLTRRFSYTSVQKGGAAPSSISRTDVPYARLIDTNMGLCNSKIDSDSKLNKTVLNVPQMESSVSDSKIALNCFNKDSTLTHQTLPKKTSHVRQDFPSLMDTSKVGKVSESHSTLPSQTPTEEMIYKEVQRTVSINSENQSETFFSAEEEMLPSRSSSLKNSSACRQEFNKKIFSSNEVGNDKEKCTPLLSRTDSIKIPTSCAFSSVKQHEPDSNSMSSTSFISALSSQEDMTFVNLQQSNRPIVDSPLLMASYMNFLQQAKCVNWSSCNLPGGADSFTAALFKKVSDGSLVYIGEKYLPAFEMLGSNNTMIRLMARQEFTQNHTGNHSNPGGHFISQGKIHPYSQAWWEVPQMTSGNQESNNKETENMATLNADNRSAIFIRFRGEVNFMISPLSLESFQRFVEALTPVVANLHPISVLNHLHMSCIETVENVNVLKQDKHSLNWMNHFQINKSFNQNEVKNEKCKLSTIPQTHSYEETISSRLQVTFNIPKINIMLIQSSVVDDMVSLSSLDNIQELSCASLLSLSIENINAKYLCARQMLETIQIHHRPTIRALGHKKTFGIMKGPRSLISAHVGSLGSSKHGKDKGDPVYIETSQKKCEDTNIIFTIGKANAQLRRLNVDSPQLKDAIITGIPSHHSKVFFKCIKINDAGPKVGDTDKLHPQQSQSVFDDNQSENRIGYIMFECGLEGVSIKFSKHSQMDKNDNCNDDKMTCKTESDCYPESVRSCDDIKTEKASKLTKSTGLDEIFKKKDSASSKPSTPNLNNIDVVIPIEPETNVECTSIVPIKDTGRASACVIDLKTVWFNFAAPPRTPITKKIDYTRLDWNLLSTASPAINAWMNPCNRLGIRIVALYRAYYRRVTATSASLMAAALDIPQLHMPIKSRYARQTPMAAQLREEPSLQLCSALLRYALQADAAAVQADLADRHLPSLSTLRQGVIVLSRQWKNILYTPLLLEHNYKTKLLRPLNVKFTLPDMAEEGPPETWADHDDVEILDESSMLLNLESGKLSIPVSMAIASNGGNSFTSSSPPSVMQGPPAPSNKSSLVFPMLPFSTRKAHLQDDSTPVYGTLKEDLPAVGSNLSIYSSNDSEENEKNGDKKQEDLYSWMAKQDPLDEHNIMKGVTTSIPVYLGSKFAGVINQSTPACSLYPLQDSLMLVEAHLIFQPFLSSLGVSPHQVGQGASSSSTSPSTLDAIGSNLSLVAWMDMFRIDIVVSEFGKVERKKNTKSHAKGKSGNPSHIDIPSETPAFLCEKVGIDIDLKKIADMTVDDLIQRQNVLYISRGQLKKHINTMLNFNLSIRYISQQVNMPLLRLLHQISNMYQNVKDTQSELRGQSKISRRQNKHTSSSASDFHENVTSVTSLDKDIPIVSHDGKWEPSMAIPINPLSTTSAASVGIPQSLSQQKLQQSTTTRSRPQSFAQKLRSTGKSVKGRLGYSSLHEGAHTPMYTEDLGVGGERTSSIIGSLVGAEGVLPSITTNIEVKMTPRCWRTVYVLLDLYAAMPDSKTITHRFSLATELPENYKKNKASAVHTVVKEKEHSGGLGITIVGGFRIHRTRLLASLSGLKLEAEITSLQASLQASKTSQWSLAGHLGRTMIVLLEGVAPNQQTVVRVTVGKSQTLYESGANSSSSHRGRSSFLNVGAVRVDLPQHPVALHGVMTRSSRQLSCTLQELGVTRAASRTSRPHGDTGDDSPHRPPATCTPPLQPSPPRTPSPPPAATHSQTTAAAQSNAQVLLNPLVMQFSIGLQSLSITAALLPSLQAQYKMDRVQSVGVTGNKANFTVDLPQHSLSFVTKLQVSEVNLPSAASIALPPVHVSAQYVAERETNSTGRMGTSSSAAHLGTNSGSNGVPHPGPQESPGGTDSPIEGVVLRQGSYLSATAEIGIFEHSLSTDLLNHLVFVQKVFMKEVNEVVQKVYGGEKPVPLWLEEGDPSSTLSRILFSLIIRVKRIQLTATTPSNSAVRLETGAVEFQISNRVQNVSQSSAPYNMKLFAKVQFDVNLSLGQLIRNAMFEEAEPEFQQYAFFKTRIALRNAFQDEMVSGEDKEVVLITLKRPLIYIQPMAVDKAILVWLNYKNAYEYWNEKRLNLNKEVLTATQQVFQKVQLSSQLTSSNLSTLFLQLTVDDMGICLPLNQPPLTMASWAPGAAHKTLYDLESRGAVVVTLESTSISACSSGSLVSKGRFVGLCLRFADDFETSLDDWKPDMTDTSIMNLCSVSEGTYEVCSRTIAAKQNIENAKWFLNVSWQMEGVDIHLDVNVGKQLSALGHTLTMLTGFEEEDPMKDYSSDYDDEGDVSKDSQDSVIQRSTRKWSDNLPAFIFDTTIDAKKRSKLIEKEMNEQAKIIQDLRMLGASHGTIEHEMKRLHELEALVFKDFRSVYFRDMIQKLRRQSVKTSTQSKGKLVSNRSRSFVVPSPMPEQQLEMDNLESPIGMSLAAAAEVSDSGETLLLGGESEGSPGIAGNLADIMEGGSWSSMESSPMTGPSRSASLRGRMGGGQIRTVTFNPSITRQSSLPTGAGGSVDQDDLDEADSWGSHIDIQGESVQLRKKNQTIPTLESSSSVSSAAKKTQEPNIDFELDVTVLINRGKCVLHTKDPMKDEEIKIQQRMRKERSASGGLSELTQVISVAPPSPSVSRKHHKSTHNTSHHARSQAALVDLTIFHIPGLDVKVHYESKTVQEDGASPQGYLSAALSRKTGIKKAALFAWMTLQSIPEETIISPHILEFLEQTLEPIPTKASFSSAALSDANDKDKIEDMDAVSYGQYVYASFPVDVIVYFHMQPSTFRFSCLPVSRVECMLQLPSLGIVFSSKRAQQDEINPGVAMGGLSVTGCLADFSVYIFHPYGGKKSGLKEAQWSPLSDSERKDALSINVEFVKFHLSRSRKVDYQTDQEQSAAMVHFSTIVDIGSASFKYDMRRLTEILAFPKAWYRRTIVRRLFLGDLSLSAPSETDASTQPHTPAPLSSQRDRSKAFEQERYKENGKSSSLESPPSPSEPQSAAWETIVMFAVNFTKLNVHMNMGNVMGNVSWLSRDFHCMGRLNIGSTGHRNMYVSVGLGSSSLEAKGGIVGGTISLSTIDTYVHVMEEPGEAPAHRCGVRARAIELRLDYMGSGVLMARVSSFTAALRDQWHRDGEKRNAAQQLKHDRPPIILVHGNLSWEQLQLMISRSTTPDLVKMQIKLEEFFTQQFKSSKRVFSSFHPSYAPSQSQHSKTSRQRKDGECPALPKQGDFSEVHHHRHWQKVLNLIAGVQLSSFPARLPSSGTVLGGTMDLHGSHISLACFHGINFKSKSWALFSLKDPCISFATEAQQVSTERDDGEVHVIQSLTASLGGVGSGPVQHHSMATVCRITRNVIFPPQFKTLREWFHYAFSNSEIDAVETFPSLERESGSMERDRERSSDGAKDRRPVAPGSAPKLTDPNHGREVIFALPSLQLHLKTQHLQRGRTPTSLEEKPVVECSFITEFEDHIFVTVDAEAFFFLHDLISSYVREKERVMTSGVGRSHSPDVKHPGGSSDQNSSGEGSSKGKPAPELFTKDWRNYSCTTWHLEPTVRLLSWGGKSIEPYGVDYILQKLGFSHARTTIPKWLQRGSLDPLDKLLALILMRLVSIVPQK